MLLAGHVRGEEALRLSGTQERRARGSVLRASPLQVWHLPDQCRWLKEVDLVARRPAAAGPAQPNQRAESAPGPEGQLGGASGAPAGRPGQLELPEACAS